MRAVSNASASRAASRSASRPITASSCSRCSGESSPSRCCSVCAEPMIDASGVRTSWARIATNAARRATLHAQLLELAAESSRVVGHRAHALRSSMRASAQRACSASSSSSPVGVALERRARARLVGADVAERDERVPAQPARVVARHVEAVELGDELAPVGLEPRDEIDVRAPRRARAPRAAARRRGSTGRRPGRCRSRRPARRAPRGRAPAPARAPASSTRGSASRRARRARRARRSGRRRCSACTSRSRGRAAASARARPSVTSVPSTTQEPWRRVISIVFFP